MNQTDFRKRLYSNPLEPDAETLEQANLDPELGKILRETQQMEKNLHHVLSTLAVPSSLQAKLMAIPDTDISDQGSADTLQRLAEKPAANANYFQYFAIAATLVLALGVSFSLTFTSDAGPSTAEIAFGNEVLQHLYHEDVEIAAINSGGDLPTVGMPMIIQAMAPVGAQLASASATMVASIKFAKPCVIIRAFDSAHLILQGPQGAISVIVINNTPVSVEYSINDDRFSGVVVPMEKGNMVLVGESNADLTEYKKLFAENVDWVI
ncbi:MAG: hypothetical protein ACI95C_001572 [Pseudohongiellaceae bacterium]|jgi:hypothetical protein